MSIAAGGQSVSDLKLQPNDANAEANLVAELGRYSESASHLERALQIEPNHSDAKDNLEAVRKP